MVEDPPIEGMNRHPDDHSYEEKDWHVTEQEMQDLLSFRGEAEERFYDLKIKLKHALVSLPGEELLVVNGKFHDWSFQRIKEELRYGPLAQDYELPDTEITQEMIDNIHNDGMEKLSEKLRINKAGVYQLYEDMENLESFCSGNKLYPA